MEQQIKELTLLLAYLTSWDDKDRLTKQENKDKYFIWEGKGIAEAERLIEKYNINKD